VWWERELTVEASNPDNAHRPLDKSHNLAASLSHVETRQVGRGHFYFALTPIRSHPSDLTHQISLASQNA
jgi:hypothetical protein